MKKIFKPACLLMYFLAIIIFFVIGATIAGLSGAAEGQGLASGAIVFFYGLIGSFIGLVLAIFIAYQVEHKFIFRINRIFGVLFLVIACLATYKFLEQKKKQVQPKKEIQRKTTAPAKNLALLNYSNTAKYINPSSGDDPIPGMGFFSPNFYENKTLYFYKNLNIEKAVNEHSVYDSITFQFYKNEQIEIATAPPWLMPKHLKLEYGILYFEVKSISEGFVEVIGNQQTQQRTFLDRQTGKMIYWPDFLLNVNSVEFKSEKIKMYL